MLSVSKSASHLEATLRTLISFKTLTRFSTSSPNKKRSHNKALCISTLPTSSTSVPDFLKQNGFSDTHITNLIYRQPRLLTFKIDKTLKPKFNLLQELGFSGSSLADLILHNPNILIRGTEKFLIPTIDFLKSILHSNENVLKVIKRSNWLLSYGPHDRIPYNIGILRGCGISDERISKFFMKQPRFFTQKSEWVEGIVLQVEEFGVQKNSGLFLHGIMAMKSMSKDTIKQKVDIYKSYGWTDYDIKSAFKKCPNFLTYSEQKIRETMTFVVDELGYDPILVALKPKLLSYSLEKRLRPRNKVLKILKSKKLMKTIPCLTSVVNLSEKKFLENYVVMFIGKAPGLKRAYKGLNSY